jgi:hypothetical protein
VLEDGEALKAMLGYSKDKRKVPVIVDAERVIIGFDGGS